VVFGFQSFWDIVGNVSMGVEVVGELKRPAW
jgi:hypothetical protein